MKKIELLARIEKLSSIVHSKDLAQFNLDEASINEMRRSLDELTDSYVNEYCSSIR